jgi:hypothetical protein
MNLYRLTIKESRTAVSENDRGVRAGTPKEIQLLQDFLQALRIYASRLEFDLRVYLT